VIGVSPLFPAIRSDLGVAYVVVGLLVTIPVLCMGLFAPSARDVASRFGVRRSLSGCLLAIATVGVLRAVVPGAGALIVLTVPIGIAMGLSGPLLAMFVKNHFADRPAFATGVYATGLQISAAAAAPLAVPLASAMSGWRSALLVFSTVTFVFLVAWIMLTRSASSGAEIRPERLRLPLRNKIAWVLVILFGLQSLVFYGLVAWLPDLYVDHGWSERRAGLLLALLSVAGVLAGLVVPWFADRWGSRRSYLIVSATVLIGALLGIELMPGGAWLWAVSAGAAGGVMFAVCLTLPLDVADLPGRVGSVAGMMLLGGYTIAALGPLGLGAVRDLTGGFEVGIALLVVAASGVIVGALTLTPRRLARGVDRAEAVAG
jgi:CP family cyanate transporter-like MFS transporter